MQSNKTADEMSDFMVNTLKRYFDGRVNGFVAFDIADEPYKTFSINFEAYNYYRVLFTYDRGRIGCCLPLGEYAIGLSNSQKWFDKADFQVFCEELQKQLELRIPDKFLKANGWLR